MRRARRRAAGASDEAGLTDEEFLAHTEDGYGHSTLPELREPLLPDLFPGITSNKETTAEFSLVEISVRHMYPAGDPRPLLDPDLPDGSRRLRKAA